MNIQFKEEQQYRQWWLILLLLGVSAIPIYGIIQQVVLDKPFGDKPTSDGGLVISFLLSVGVFMFFWFVKLKTNINGAGIEMNYFPFAKKEVKWSEIKEVKVVNYCFVGGWGLRYFTKYGTVYNVAGRHGLAIQLKSGIKFLIGTQRPEELKEKLKRAQENSL